MNNSKYGQYNIWVSHSKISEFIKCPKAYYLHNLYHNPLTGNKITLINPHLALGQAVHETLDVLSTISCEERSKFPLLETFNDIWEEKYNGKKGGFGSTEEEIGFKERGGMMIKKVSNNLGPLVNKRVRLLSHDQFPPRYVLSKEEGILLSGKVDWMEYFELNKEAEFVRKNDFQDIYILK